MAKNKDHEQVGEAEGGDVCKCGYWGPDQRERR